ncbi:hypothetical protein LAV79_12530 [Peribacillus butanolivorans]|uniref:hypothetical protein n=1 Tax=Peribacillus butanolivorans TaxID=421767 RepID=UPI0030C95E3C
MLLSYINTILNPNHSPYLFLKKKNNRIKCFFDVLSDRIREKLINQGYNKYYEQDFEIKKALLVSSMATINQTGETEIRLQNGSDISGKISHRLNKTYSHLSRGEYIEYLGFIPPDKLDNVHREIW